MTLPAPLGQPPLLLRAGAVLPLIGADVDTLSPYGRAAGLVRLADRADRLRLLAVPRGRTRSRLPDGGRVLSDERRAPWALGADAAGTAAHAVHGGGLARLAPPALPPQAACL